MTKLLGLLAIMIVGSSGIASACPPLSTAAVPDFAPLPLGSSMYYCSASAQPQTVGDLAYADWAKHVQVCTTNCAYEAIAPGDPHSALIPVSCGAGRHAALFYVEPPTSTPGKALKLTNPSCNNLAPSKAPPQPAPSPSHNRGRLPDF